MSDIKFNEVELQTVNLLPGDVLSVKLIGDDFDLDTTESLKQYLSTVFPLNKVMVFTMPTKTDIQFQVIKTDPEQTSCADPIGYCSSCDCGKKEQVLGEQNG